MDRDTDSGVNSIVLTDLAANVDAKHRSPDNLFAEILLSTLLYDEVLIQDEVFVLSDQILRWFSQKEYKDIFAACLETGAIKILTHPRELYTNDDLAELSESNPFLARARHINTVGTKGSASFSPSIRQRNLYTFLDYSLSEHITARRPVRQIAGFNVMDVFARVLLTILTNPEYDKWLAHAFPGVRHQMAIDFAEIIAAPETGIALLKKSGKDPKVRMDRARVEFNRSFAYQIASLYPAGSRESMYALIQTCFAAPFCWRENASGRYDSGLRELLLDQDDASDIRTMTHPTVRVEYLKDIPLVLPGRTIDLAKAIVAVRNSAVGESLREAMKHTGSEPDFQRQYSAWSAVAAEIAGYVHNRREGNIRLTALNFGRELLTGAAVSGMSGSLMKPRSLLGDPVTELLRILGESAINSSITILGPQVNKLMQSYLQKQKLCRQLECLIDFRCVNIPQPPRFSV